MGDKTNPFEVVLDDNNTPFYLIKRFDWMIKRSEDKNNKKKKRKDFRGKSGDKNKKNKKKWRKKTQKKSEKIFKNGEKF